MRYQSRIAGDCIVFRHKEDAQAFASKIFKIAVAYLIHDHDCDERCRREFGEQVTAMMRGIGVEGECVVRNEPHDHFPVMVKYDTELGPVQVENTADMFSWRDLEVSFAEEGVRKSIMDDGKTENTTQVD
jgi:hypothetical protein